LFDAESMGKLLILIGIFLVLFGVLFTFGQRLPFLGRLPGDIFIQKDGFSSFSPWPPHWLSA